MVYAADLKSVASACGFESRQGHLLTDTAFSAAICPYCENLVVLRMFENCLIHLFLTLM